MTAASKRALPATEAGLRQASYKLNNLKPLSTECPTGFVADGALCRGSANATTMIDGGNGVLYDYWLTKSNPAGKCAGFPVGTDPQLEVRCVTAEATVNGVARRSQARLVRPTGLNLFPFPGVFGDRYVKLKNDSTVNGALGSNDLIDLSGSFCIRDGRKIGTPGGRVVGSNPQSGAGCSSAVTYNTASQGPFVVAPVDFASTHLPANNQNGNWSGTHTWNATTRNLRITGNSFTFNGGTYNLCSLYIEGGTIYIPSGATVKIYLDSRPESGCTGGGSLIGNNNVTFIESQLGRSPPDLPQWPRSRGVQQPTHVERLHPRSECSGRPQERRHDYRRDRIPVARGDEQAQLQHSDVRRGGVPAADRRDRIDLLPNRVDRMCVHPRHGQRSDLRLLTNAGGGCSRNRRASRSRDRELSERGDPPASAA